MSSPWRRTKCAATAVAAALALTASLGTDPTAATPAQAAPEPFDNGTGSATAEALRVNPVNGGLSFGVGTAQSLASHQNLIATSESRGVSLGVIGVTLAGEGCDGGDPTLPSEDQPQPLRADSNQEGADIGFRALESIAGVELPGALLERFVRATPTPRGEAETTAVPFGIPGVLEITGARAHAVSGVVNGDTREAVATTYIAEISIAGGLLRLGDITSQAIHRSGAVEEVSGSFSIGSVTLAGQRIPLDGIDAVLRQVNTLLNLQGLGISLNLPEFREGRTANGTVALMTPLSIGIRSAAETPLGQIFRALVPTLGPIQQDLYAALLELDCGNSTYTTVLDLVLGSLSPGGSLTIELGNVSATTSQIDRFQFPSATPTARPSTPTPAAPAPAAPSSPTPQPVARPATPTPAAPAAPAPVERPATPLPESEPVGFVGTRGGWMAAVAGGGLGLLVLCAEGDRRKMRRAQRLIPLEG